VGMVALGNMGMAETKDNKLNALTDAATLDAAVDNLNALTDAAAAVSQYTPKLAIQFGEAGSALRALHLELHTESTKYGEWLCLCNEELISFMVEVNLVKNPVDQTKKYRFISAKVDENCVVSVDRPVDSPGSNQSSPPKTPDRVENQEFPDSMRSAISVHLPSNSNSNSKQNLMARFSQDLGSQDSEQQQELGSQGSEEQQGSEHLKSGNSSNSGGRPTSKKSTHRKPHRHTRNYQSHNKKPKRSSRSTKYNTIKHRKSYRKHNRTIKRRGNRK